MRAYTDSKSIFDAVIQERPKMTTERQTMGHITFLKQKKTQRIMELSWVDTRSQPADSLTKGSVDRNIIHSIMNGAWHCEHGLKHAPTELETQLPGFQ
eukprot:3858470-Amphidinium_carterae.1